MVVPCGVALHSYTLSNCCTPQAVIPYPIVVPPQAAHPPSYMPTHTHYLVLLYLAQYSATTSRSFSHTRSQLHSLAYVVIMYSHPRKPAQPHWDHQTSIFPHQPICLRQRHSSCFIQQQHHSSCFIQQPTSRSRTSPSTSKTGYQDRVRSIY